MPNWLINAPSFPNSSFCLGIAVGLEDTNLHTGIFYIHDDKPMFLHFGWHTFLLNRESSNYSHYRWTKINVLEQRAIAITALCKRVWKRKSFHPYYSIREDMPYGLLYEGAKFGQDGSLILDGRSRGLTCATFVMTILKEAGIDLLIEKEWKEREEDIPKQKQQVATLENPEFTPKISPEHLEAVRKEIGCIRFRPEEVTAAPTYKEFPAPFLYCEKIGAEILEVTMKKD